MAGKVPSRREAKKPKKSKKAKATTLEPLSQPPMPTVEVIKPKRKPKDEEEWPE
jgi:hypothetical protein